MMKEKKNKKNDLTVGEWISLVGWRIVLGAVFAVLALIVLAVIVMFYVWFHVAIVKLLVTVAAGVLAVLLLTKKRRARASFARKLKKICNEKKYRLVCHRPFGKALSWNDGKPDFEFHLNGHRHEVCFVTPKNKSVKIRFEEKDHVKMIVPPLPLGKISEAFNLQPKVTEFPLPESPTDDETVRILVINPDRCEVLCKGSEGTLVAAGDGGTYFGRMVYTGNGLLKALERGDIVPRKKNFNKIDF